MKSQRTQVAWVKQCLRERGQISRNEALANYISRLGAIICSLKKEGWEIDGWYEYKGNSKDYMYRLRKAPVIRKIEIINGRAVEVVQQSKLI